MFVHYLNKKSVKRVADIGDVCNTVSDVLDSMFSATLPRQYHVKDLIEKELQFYPTNTCAFERSI